MSKARLKAKNVLGIAEGGTGATSMGAGAVGAVAQAAGVPTGTIVESGSNANGRYTKWADGTMICTRTLAINQSISAVAGAIFYSQLAAQTYAVSFVGALPTTAYAIEDLTGLSWVTAGTAGTLNACSLLNLMAPISRGASAYTIYITAIGRWF
jgi:hypothetical protein